MCQTVLIHHILKSVSCVPVPDLAQGVSSLALLTLGARQFFVVEKGELQRGH